MKLKNISAEDLKIYATFVRSHARRFFAEQAHEARARPVPPARHHPMLATWSDDRLTLAWLGHATVLINFYGTWLLTDPALRERVGLNVGLATIGPRRLIQPALEIRELPQLDAVLISHAHFDHCDRQTLRRISRNTHAVVQKGNDDLVRRFKRISALGWGESVEIKQARIEAIETNHWGARTLTDKHRGYGGYLITKNNRSIVFGGDTAYTNAFARLRKHHHQQIDLAILPIGAYDPYIYAHASPEQAWAMMREMNATYILPIHHSTFRLSREPVHEPLKRLLAAAGNERWRIIMRQVGETWTLPED